MGAMTGEGGKEPAPATPRHPIGVVAERTALSPDVLRVWERRYGAVRPARSAGGQRLYTDADVERLRLLSRATHAGRSIGQVAGLDTASLAALVREDEAQRGAARASSPDRAARIVSQALRRMERLDADGVRRGLARAAVELGAADFVEGVAAPLLREVGDGWHAGRVTTAQEHLVSGVVRGLLARLVEGLEVPEPGVRLVVATPAGERHEIGALLVAAVAAQEGWGVAYLGPDLPAGEIAAAAVAVGARGVAVSAIYAADPGRLVAELRALRAGLPGEVALLAGGSGAGAASQELADAGVQHVSDLAELRTVLGRLRGGG